MAKINSNQSSPNVVMADCHTSPSTLKDQDANEAHGDRLLQLTFGSASETVREQRGKDSIT